MSVEILRNVQGKGNKFVAAGTQRKAVEDFSDVLDPETLASMRERKLFGPGEVPKKEIGKGKAPAK